MAQHDVDDLIDWAQSHQWSVSRTKSNHLKLQHPEVKMPIFTSGTPSDFRASLNAKAQMRRALRDAEAATAPVPSTTELTALGEAMSRPTRAVKRKPSPNTTPAPMRYSIPHRPMPSPDTDLVNQTVQVDPRDRLVAWMVAVMTMRLTGTDWPTIRVMRGRYRRDPDIVQRAVAKLRNDVTAPPADTLVPNAVPDGVPDGVPDRAPDGVPDGAPDGSPDGPSLWTSIKGRFDETVWRDIALLRTNFRAMWRSRGPTAPEIAAPEHARIFLPERENRLALLSAAAARAPAPSSTKLVDESAALLAQERRRRHGVEQDLATTRRDLADLRLKHTMADVARKTAEQALQTANAALAQQTGELAALHAEIARLTARLTAALAQANAANPLLPETISAKQTKPKRAKAKPKATAATPRSRAPQPVKWWLKKAA